MSELQIFFSMICLQASDRPVSYKSLRENTFTHCTRYRWNKTIKYLQSQMMIRTVARGQYQIVAMHGLWTQLEWALNNDKQLQLFKGE